MKVVDPGHVYTLHSYDGNFPQSVTFMKRDGDGYPGNLGAHPGTNCQELLRVLIDRVKYLDQQIPSKYNSQILRDLRNALLYFEIRAAERHGVQLNGNMKVSSVETVPTCETCGHIQCEHD